MTEKKKFTSAGGPRPGGKARRSAGRANYEEKTGIFRIESLSAIRDFLKNRPEQLLSLHCQKDQESRVREALSGLSLPEVRIKEDPDSPPLWAEVRLLPLAEKTLSFRTAGRERDLIVALDHITDPRNLGAIARSAAFFGVKEILLPKDRQVCFSHASVNTSQGAFSLTDLVQVTNLPRILRQLKQEGYWIVGCDMKGGEPEEVAGRFSRVVLVLGNEEKGLSRLVRELCDIFVGIRGIAGGLDSLNVSVAAAIMIRGFAGAEKT